MEDKKIIELYFERNELAIEETKRCFGRYCMNIALNILGSAEDAEECVNDTYLRLWNNIPPHRPESFLAYIGKIIRNIALDKYRKKVAQKRNIGHTPLVLEELAECVSDSSQPEFSDVDLKDTLNSFLSTLKKENLQIFMRRYWYMDSVKDIANRLNISESKVKTILFRTRMALKSHLSKEGITV